MSSIVRSLRENFGGVCRRAGFLGLTALSLTAGAHAVFAVLSPSNKNPNSPIRLKLWPEQWAEAIREYVVSPASWSAEPFEGATSPQYTGDQILGPPGDLAEGIDDDGRIPKVLLPDDLAYPERWRYIPEGLIPPGNLIDRFLATTFITPIVFFEGDVGTGGGLQIADIDLLASRRQMLGTLRLSYTTEGQQQYKATWRRWYHQRELPAGGIIQEERSWIGATAGFTRTLTRRFYGFGADSDENAESSYSESLSEVGVFQDLTFPQPGDDWVLSWGTSFERRNLGEGEIVGIPDTQDAFAEPFDEGDGLDVLWLHGGIRFDTRDSQHLPYAGGMVGVGVDYSPIQSGRLRGAVIAAAASRIWPIYPLFHQGGDPEEEHPPIDTIALGVQVQDTAGNLPFWALPSLGGNYTLRGFPPDRFIDESALHYSLEYRLWLLPRGFAVIGNSRVERLGAALFVEGGTVAASSRDFFEEDHKWSAGVGIRMTFERQALFRVDIGFSEEGSNLAVNFGLSF